MVIALVSDKLVEPRLGAWQGGKSAGSGGDLSPNERRGLKFALWGFLAVLALFALLALPSGAPMRHPQTDALIGDSPFMQIHRFSAAYSI